MPATRPVIETDPDRTRVRVHALREYFDANVFEPSENLFRCSRYLQGSNGLGCKCSAKAAAPNGDFYRGQLHHVGDHFDTFVDDKPLRIVVLGMSYGTSHEYHTLEKRTEMIRDNGQYCRARGASDDFPARNPHMSGTTYALRCVYGLDLDQLAQETENIPTGDGLSVHLFETFSLMNFLLCSATLNGSMRDNSTPQMRANCVAHLRRALEILQPTLIISQGFKSAIQEGLVLGDAEFFPEGGDHVSVKKLLLRNE